MVVVENAWVELRKSVGLASENQNLETALQDDGDVAVAAASKDQDKSKRNATPLRHHLDQSDGEVMKVGAVLVAWGSLVGR
ncbi:unnamed protein product [Prunus armeniaca]|uniref:Uncharacterized protein n=1 Tax=Prunus armeniaca TaxID=36596 RepID=A0A6J5UCK8_PRUAR|nr:unnamed protein product [Prunus armeniaca]